MLQRIRMLGFDILIMIVQFLTDLTHITIVDQTAANATPINGLAMTANRLTQSKARMNESEKNGVCISANVVQSAAAPSQFRLAIATMGPVLASAFCVAAIMYPLGDR